jgi:hypothetical protein
MIILFQGFGQEEIRFLSEIKGAWSITLARKSTPYSNWALRPAPSLNTQETTASFFAFSSKISLFETIRREE